MKRIFCRFLSIGLILTIVFKFFIPQDASAVAVKVTDILYDDASTTECLPTMTYLTDYLAQRSVPDVAEDADQLWATREVVAKTLSLIFYKILSSEKRESTDTAFFSPDLIIPTVTIRDYMNRILIYGLAGRIPHACIIMTLMCLDEVRRINAGTLFIEKPNVHRLFITSYLVSLKFNEDFFYDNKYMARVAGVPTTEFNDMEIEFLARIRFHLLFEQAQIDGYDGLFTALMRKVPNLEWDLDDVKRKTT